MVVFKLSASVPLETMSVSFDDMRVSFDDTRKGENGEFCVGSHSQITVGAEVGAEVGACVEKGSYSSRPNFPPSSIRYRRMKLSQFRPETEIAFKHTTIT